MKQISNTIWMRARGSVCLLAAGLLVASCSSDDDSGTSAPEPPTFDTFVIEQFGNTADDTEPVPINDRNFTFGSDAAAFDDLLQ